mgnify:CR=1 FL=1
MRVFCNISGDVGALLLGRLLCLRLFVTLELLLVIYPIFSSSILSFSSSSFDTSTEALTELWKEKYARKRITNLINNDRINLDETLFYDDVCFQSWEETKAKYLGEVGR